MSYVSSEFLGYLAGTSSRIESPLDMETDELKPWKETGEAPLDWFRRNFDQFMYSQEHIVENAVHYELGAGPNAGGVYFLLSGKDIVYVGLATAIYSRLVQHADGGKRYTHYWCITGIPDMFLKHVEAFYLHYLRPPLNVQYRYMDEFLRGRVKGALSRQNLPRPGRTKSGR